MKKLIVVLSMFSLFLLAGCGWNQPQEDLSFVDVDVVDEVDVSGTLVTSVNTQDSSVVWSAKRVLYGYTGDVAVTQGSLTFVDGEPVAGSFVLDVAGFTLNGPQRARDDVAAEGFFDVANYPEATLLIADVNTLSADQFAITADLTIKDETHPVEFVATFAVDRSRASATIDIDRTVWGLNYQSSSFFSDLGNRAIDDTISFVIALVLE